MTNSDIHAELAMVSRELSLLYEKLDRLASESFRCSRDATDALQCSFAERSDVENHLAALELRNRLAEIRLKLRELGRAP